MLKINIGLKNVLGVKSCHLRMKPKFKIFNFWDTLTSRVIYYDKLPMKPNTFPAFAAMSAINNDETLMGCRSNNFGL